MKRKVLFIVLCSFLLTGVVSAASLWGVYKGNQIVRVKVDGTVYKPTSVPAVAYNGQTMLPLDVLKKLGITYTWDNKNKTINLDTPLSNIQAPPPAASGFNISDISKEMKKINIEFVEYVSDGRGFNSLAFHYDYSFDSLIKHPTAVDTIFAASLNTDATLTKLVDIDGNSMAVTNTSLRDYYAGKIDADQFMSLAKLEGPLFKSNGTSTGSPTIPLPKSYPVLYSNDGKTYLGKLTSNKYDSDSIFNEYGTHGSKYSSDSIWNEYGDYGSKYSSESAFNKFASDPPIIILDGKTIGYLTINTTIKGAVSPVGLREWLESNGY